MFDYYGKWSEPLIICHVNNPLVRLLDPSLGIAIPHARNALVLAP